MTVACVFSGGGAKTAAQVGAHRALDESGMAPARYVGTSMGAVLAACFAAGLDYEAVLRKITTMSRWDFATPSPRSLFGPFAEGLFSAAQFKETLRELLPVHRFSELAKPLSVTAVDVGSGDLVVFGAGGSEHVALVDALYASCALPFYYPPAEIDGRKFVDGGLRAVLPLQVANQFALETIFAVMVGPKPYDEDFDASRSTSLLRAYDSALRILMGAQTEDVLGQWRHSSACELILVQPVVEAGRPSMSKT
ncbi:MAG: patatin-like phospholipase family protein [Gemmatimonadales bacterium]